MTAIDTAFALVIAVLTVVALSFIGVIFVGAARIAVHGDEDGMCAPSRRANITANQSHAERRIALLGLIDAVPLAQLPSALAWDDELQGWAPPKPQPRRQQAACCSPWRYDEPSMIRENSLTYDLASLTAPAVPELPPVAPVVEPQVEQGIAVEDWPTQVVQPVPLSKQQTYR